MQHQKEAPLKGLLLKDALWITALKPTPKATSTYKHMCRCINPQAWIQHIMTEASDTLIAALFGNKKSIFRRVLHSLEPGECRQDAIFMTFRTHRERLPNLASASRV